jgi:excinuclease ABC subunit B
VNGLVVMYADKITESMDKVISETKRRREIQTEYNKVHNIEPKTIYKTYEEIMSSTIVADSKAKNEYGKNKKDEKKSALSILTDPFRSKINKEQRKELIDQLRKEMINAAKDLEFERAAELRDEIDKLNV